MCVQEYEVVGTRGVKVTKIKGLEAMPNLEVSAAAAPSHGGAFTAPRRHWC